MPDYIFNFGPAQTLVEIQGAGLLAPEIARAQGAASSAEALAWQVRGSDDLMALAGDTALLFNVWGQSKGAGAVGYSQTWRDPAYWDRNLDGPALLSNVQVGNNQTIFGLNNGAIPIELRPYDDFTAGAFGAEGDGGSVETLGHGLLDHIWTRLPGQQLAISVASSEGGRSIDWLRKPTTAEIIAGVMRTNMGDIAIPQTSVEYQMHAKGETFADIWKYNGLLCATRFYAGAWTLSGLARLYALQGKRSLIPAMSIVHGETDSDIPNTRYAEQLVPVLRDLQTMARQITGQTRRVIFAIEITSYSKANEIGVGGAASAGPYTPEADRVNDMRAINIQQLKIPSMAPDLDCIIAGCGYFESSRIHYSPHIYRSLGERHARAVLHQAYGRQRWRTFQPVEWWIDGPDVFIRFDTPTGTPIALTAPPNTGTHFLKAGKPYGLEHSAGAIPDGGVQVVGSHLLKITPAVAPAKGQTIGYVQSVRAGSITDSETTPNVYTDRAGNTNPTVNAACPFVVTL